MDKEESQDAAFERVKRRAEAKLRGMTEEAVELAEIGVTIIDDDMEVNNE